MDMGLRACGTCSHVQPYMIRASFSKKRMTYLPEQSKVIYRSNGGKEEEVFGALGWLATMDAHVTDKRGEMVK